MKLLKRLPLINPNIVSVSLSFAGQDTVPGSRHFLEHLMCNSNKILDRILLREGLHRCGNKNGAGAATSESDIRFDFTCLNECADEMVYLVSSMLGENRFLGEEIEKEREIILQEYSQNYLSAPTQLNRSLEELFGLKLCPLGTPETISAMTADHLRQAYAEIFTYENAELFYHSQAPIEDRLLQHLAKGTPRILPTFTPSGAYKTKNPLLGYSLVMLVFDVKDSLNSRFLAAYLNSLQSPLLMHLRENLRLCYAAQAMPQLGTTIPYFAVLTVTDKDPEMVLAEMRKSLVVDDPKLYNPEKLSTKMDIELMKTSISRRMGYEKSARDLAISFDEVTKVPSWEELRDFAKTALTKEIATVIIEK